MSITPPAAQAPLRPRLICLFASITALALACTSATATPDPTPTSPPTATVAPTANATSAPAVVDTAGLDAATEESFSVVEEIVEELGPRESATEQEAAAADYLVANFLELGYQTEIQAFIVKDLAMSGMGLTLDTDEPMEFRALPLDQTGLGEVSGVLTAVGLAMPGDIPEGGLEGRIAFAKRGVITFQAKAENVFAAGAVGLVIYNNVFGLFRGVLASQPEFPVISISRNDGEVIEELLAESEIQGSIGLRLVDLPSRNVIAEKKVANDSVVVLGGHFDSVPGVIGANDNASGTAVLVTLARMLADVDLPFTLRIIPFGSEELGLLGSEFYVQSLSTEELENTKAMLNFDALGAGSGVSVFGDPEITDLITAAGEETGVDVAVTRGLRGSTSDFAPFRDAGVPYLMFFGDDVSRIHSAGDTIEFVQPEMLGGAAVVAAALVQSPEFAEMVANQ